jgi:hypothetical protein
MRGEVLSLSRNIKVIGQPVESFGVQIVTADIMEFNGDLREGKLTLDSVEIQFGGQKDTEKGAIRYE